MQSEVGETTGTKIDVSTGGASVRRERPLFPASTRAYLPEAPTRRSSDGGK